MPTQSEGNQDKHIKKHTALYYNGHWKYECAKKYQRIFLFYVSQYLGYSPLPGCYNEEPLEEKQKRKKDNIAVWKYEGYNMYKRY